MLSSSCSCVLIVAMYVLYDQLTWMSTKIAQCYDEDEHCDNYTGPGAKQEIPNSFKHINPCCRRGGVNDALPVFR